MDKLRLLQNDLINYLVHKQDNVKHHIAESPPIDKQTRLNIYSNAYKLTLRSVIETDHELLSFYLGDELFDLLVDGYITKHPSSHTSLRDYCCNIPNYLSTTPPFKEHPILAELARFEQTLLFSFDANDSVLANWEQLNSLSFDDWPDLKIRFHPSVQLFETHYNCVDIWQALKQNKTPPDVTTLDYSAWLVWRNPDRITEFISVQANELKCITAFLHGCSLAEVCEILLNDIPEDEISMVAVTYITQWLNRSQVSYLLTE